LSDFVSMFQDIQNSLSFSVQKNILGFCKKKNPATSNYIPDKVDC